MELGNAVMGHSRGEFPIPDRYEYLDLFRPLLKALDADIYGAKISNNVFDMNPYCWCDNEDCKQCRKGEEVNFYYKPTGFKLTWYKYMFRDTYTNQAVTPESFKAIVDSCIRSLNEKPKLTIV